MRLDIAALIDLLAVCHTLLRRLGKVSHTVTFGDKIVQQRSPGDVNACKAGIINKIQMHKGIVVSKCNTRHIVYICNGHSLKLTKAAEVHRGNGNLVKIKLPKVSKILYSLKRYQFNIGEIDRQDIRYFIGIKSIVAVIDRIQKKIDQTIIKILGRYRDAVSLDCLRRDQQNA